MMATPVHGCPGSCTAQWQQNLIGFPVAIPDALETHAERCEDIPVALLRGRWEWKAYMKAIQHMYSAILNATQGEAMYNVSMLNDTAQGGGCGIASLLLGAGVDLCTPNQGGIGRSIRPFCPWACKMTVSTICTVHDLEECPPGCYFEEIKYLDIENSIVTYENKDFDPPLVRTLDMKNRVSGATTGVGDALGCKSDDRRLGISSHGRRLSCDVSSSR